MRKLQAASQPSANQGIPNLLQPKHTEVATEHSPEKQAASGNHPFSPSFLAAKNTAVAGAFLFGLFCVAAILTYSYLTYQRIYVGDERRGDVLAQASPSPDATPQPPVYTIALLGHGSPGHEGGLLTDSIMIIRVDTGLHKIGLISVPRDLWVSFPSNGWEELQYWKINAAYAIGSDDRDYPHKPEEFTGEAGGGELAKYALEKVVGFPIDYFVALDFNGFKKSIDVVGGVDVQVSRSFEDPLYPIPGEENNTCGHSEEDIAALTATMSATKLEQERVFACRYEVLSFPRGRNHMDGETALKYVRSRHSPQDGGDFNRARRQREVLLAVKEKVLALDFLPKVVPFVQKLTANMKTDISLFQMNEFLSQASVFADYEIVGIPLTADRDNILQLSVSQNGQSILIARGTAGEDDWSSVHDWIEAKMTATESAEVKTEPGKTSLPASE